jgi:hypothetical protein
MFKIIFRLLAIVLPIALVVATWNPQSALADSTTCNWTAGSGIDFYWDNGDNWTCTSGGGPPSDEDDVIISSSPANAPIVRGSAAAKSLTLSGVLIIGTGVSLTIGNGWTNQGDAVIDSQGTIVGNGEVAVGGTFHFLSSGTIDGSLTIDPLATASVAVVYVLGNVTNNGTLTGESLDAQFHMQGLLFANHGTVSTNAFYFEKGGGAVQEVTGSGAWNSGIDYLFIANNTFLTPQSDVTFGPHHFSISTSGDRLNIGAHKVTFKSPVAVGNADLIVGAPGGSIHTQGDSVSIGITNQAHFTPPLVVENGVTYAGGVFSGTITINQGSTLRVMAPPAGSITAATNVTVTGSLDGENSDVNFYMRGQNLVVNGTVSVAELHLAGAAQQTITGTGSLSPHDLVVDAPGGVRLNAPLSLDGQLALNQNLYVGSTTLVTLTETATTSADNSNTDIFGMVKRTGPFQLDKPYSFGNLYLTVVFTDAGTALPTAMTMTVSQSPWSDLPGSINRSVSIQTAGGSGWSGSLMLDYRDSELHGREDFLQAWTRSSSSASWAQIPYSEAHFGQDWILFQGLNHFSDWGLVIHTVFMPFVKR